MLYVIANQFFLTSFLLESVREADDVTVVLHPKRRRGAHRSLLKFVDAYLLRRSGVSLFFEREYIEKLSRIEIDDSVLIFGVENIKELLIVKRFVKSKKISLFTWNPVLDYNQSAFIRKCHVEMLKNIGWQIYTFDPGDAYDYDLKLTNQVYRDVREYLMDDVTPDIDVYFVGKDKGRFQKLKEWSLILRDAGLSTYFNVVKDKNGKYLEEDLKYLSSDGLAYEQNIDMIKRSKCLLEIVQNNQSGLTVRSLEAAFFGKKLITNNIHMKGSSLYNRSWVFLIGHDDPSGLKEFLESPVDRVASDVLLNFDFKHWCKQFA